MFILLLILIFLRPFISSLAFPYLNFTHSLLLAGALLSWLIFNFKSCAKLKFLKYPLLFFAVSLAVSFSYSCNKALSLDQLYKYALPLLILFFTASLSPAERPKAIKALALAGLLVSLFALYQYFFGFRHILDYMAKEKISAPFAADYLRRQRVFLPFITPNTLAGYLIMVLPLAGVKKADSWMIFPMALALLLTGSLGAFLSLFFALCVYFYLHKKLRAKQALLLLGLALCIGIFFIARSAGPGEYQRPFFSGVMRLNYWRETWGMIRHSFIAGAGPGNFNLVYSRYAHNSYLQFWAETGLLGLASLLWLTGSILRKAAGNLSLSYERDAQIALIASASAFLAHNFLDFTFFLPEVSFIWWAILGLCCSGLYRDAPDPPGQAQRS